jgi:hypothetical protein
VLKARRADANGSVDLTTIALTAGEKTPAAEARTGVGGHDHADGGEPVREGERATTADA